MILVTGATGNVGGELVRALVGAGEQVRALIRRDANRAALPVGVEGFVGRAGPTRDGRPLARLRPSQPSSRPATSEAPESAATTAVAT